jgi:hypothetical protein
MTLIIKSGLLILIIYHYTSTRFFWANNRFWSRIKVTWVVSLSGCLRFHIVCLDPFTFLFLNSWLFWFITSCLFCIFIFKVLSWLLLNRTFLNIYKGFFVRPNNILNHFELINHIIYFFLIFWMLMPIFHGQSLGKFILQNWINHFQLLDWHFVKRT